MLETIEAVIFDMDGSLIDSMWMWPEVDRIYMEKYHLEMPGSFYRDIEGMSYTETARYFLEKFPTLDCTIEEIKQEWTEMTLELYRSKVTLKPGAAEFLEHLKKRRIPMGIATSNSRELTEEALKALRIRDYFSSVCTACEVEKGKPAPDVYIKTARELGVDPAGCIVFEDVPMGILAGKNAGMTVYAVDDSFSRPYEEEKRRLADHYIHSYFEVLDELC